MSTVRRTDPEMLRQHLPAAAWPPVQDLLRELAVPVHVVKPRRSKLGDYWKPRDGRPPKITVNNDLNPYAFLVTLVHEFAHHTTWLSAKRADPHGVEWRSEYQRLMRPFLSPAILPPDVHIALEGHLRRAPASSCTDRSLMRTLLRHENEPVLVLERLPERALFLFNGAVYVKGPRMRKRYKCRCLNNHRIYIMDPLIEVLVHDPAVVGIAS